MTNWFASPPMLKQIAKLSEFGRRGEGAMSGLFGDQVHIWSTLHYVLEVSGRIDSPEWKEVICLAFLNFIRYYKFCSIIMDTQLLYENIFVSTYSFSSPALLNILGIVSRDITIWSSKTREKNSLPSLTWPLSTETCTWPTFRLNLFRYFTIWKARLAVVVKNATFTQTVSLLFLWAEKGKKNTSCSRG